MSERKEWQNHRGFVLDSVNGFEVIECEACGFKHLVPIPPPESLETIYSQEYYSVEKPLYLERYQEDMEWWNLVYSERYDLFERFLSPDRRRILDVGSGPGFFLLHGQNRGWQTLGIEPSVQAVDYSRQMGLQIIEGFLNERMAGRLGSFDVIHLHEVLEHVPDPVRILHLAYNLLDPGGLLCVIVPNDYNPLQMILRESLDYKPWWVAPPHHINYFDFSSLERLVRRCGFFTMSKTATFPMEMFLLMGENYVGHDDIGRNMHGLRKTMELNLARGHSKKLLDEMYLSLAKWGVGRECVLMAGR